MVFSKRSFFHYLYWFDVPLRVVHLVGYLVAAFKISNCFRNSQFPNTSCNTRKTRKVDQVFAPPLVLWQVGRGGRLDVLNLPVKSFINTIYF